MKKIALQLVLAIGVSAVSAGCGGGGGGGGDSVGGGTGASATGSSTSPSSGTLSVTVTDAAGAPVQQVLVNLSGTGASSALTGSGGASFPSLALGTYTAIPVPVPGLTFAPASTSVVVSAGSTATAAFVATFNTTAQITNYAAALHAQMLGTFALVDQANANQYGALNGAHFAASMNDFIGLVQSFVNSLLADVRTQSQGMPVDYHAVSALLMSYAAQDSAFVSAQWGGSPLLNGLVNSTQSTINSTYAAAKSSLP